jgi:hypothetical protein
MHGIGNQHPAETIDQFGSTLADTLKNSFHCKLDLVHGLAQKRRSNDVDVWFDNFLRIRCLENGEQNGPALDIYEYYWAHYTEDQAGLTDIARWVKQVTAGAKKFYQENKAMGEKYEDKSIFFQNGKFAFWRYSLVIRFFCGFIPAFSFFLTYALKALSYIPIVGIPFRTLFSLYADSAWKYIANVVGDIVVYNSTDQKCKFYRVRQQILSGAMNALRSLLEPAANGQRPYGKVLVVGHSLGSQVAYDAFNRLIHEANADTLKSYEGNKRDDLMRVLSGFVTFGSPLDKIAFFLRENVPPGQYIRAQLLNNFHSFKQRDWLPPASTQWPFRIKPVFIRLLDDLKWTNYYDKRDYVSGSLDYYEKLNNKDIQFNSSWFSFTHSWYWTSREMFKEIIENFLVPGGEKEGVTGDATQNSHPEFTEIQLPTSLNSVDLVGSTSGSSPIERDQ